MDDNTARRIAEDALWSAAYDVRVYYERRKSVEILAQYHRGKYMSATHVFASKERRKLLADEIRRQRQVERERKVRLSA